MSFYASYPPISTGGGGGSGTVTSVGLLDGSSTPIYTISGSPVTTSGTLTFTLSTQTANKVFASATSGGAAQPTFRTLVAADLPTGNLTDAGTDGITVTGGSGAVIGSGTSIAQHVADASHNGYLSSSDWSTFSGKQAAITIGAIGAATTNGMTLSAGTLALAAADATHGGVLTTGSQSIAGQKTVNDMFTVGTNFVLSLTTDSTTTGANANLLHPTTNLRLTNASLTSIATLDTTSVGNGHVVDITNATGASITLVNNYATPPGSSAIILTGTGANTVIPNTGGAQLIYSATAASWYVQAANYGVQPIAQGGTNATIALNNNRFMISSGGAIVEAGAVTASRVVVSDANGLPSASSTTTTQVQYLNAATGTTGTTSTNLVFSTSPSLTTPSLGVATATSINKVTLTTPATGSTLTIADGKTLTVNNSLAFSGTDSTVMTFPGASDTVETLGAVQTITAAKTFAQTKFLLQDNTTNTVTLSTTNSTTSYTIKLPAAQGGASTTLQNDGSGNLTWVSAGGGSGTVTSVGMTVPAFLSISGSPVTTSGTLAVSYSGTALPVANGGTGVTSVTTSPTASSFAGWDSNSNLFANAFIPNLATPNSSGTLTLTSTSNQIQYVTTYTQVNLPNATTLSKGQSFTIIGAGSSSITVATSGGSTIATVSSLQYAGQTFTVRDNTVNTTSAWAPSINVQGVIGGVTANHAPKFSGTDGLRIVDSTWLMPSSASVTASAVAIWDSNSNLNANNFLTGGVVTATAGITQTYSITTPQITIYTGSSNQTVKLPNLAVLASGYNWQIFNNSTGTITIQTSGAGAVTTLPPSTYGLFVADTSNTVWRYYTTPIASNAPGQYLGTATNDTATAGNIGEEIIVSRAFASATAPTTATSLDVTASALSLTAGDWEVNGYVGFTFATAPAITTATVACSTTSATLPGTGAQGVPSSNQLQITGISDQAVVSTDWSSFIPCYRVSVSTTTSFYLVANYTFTGGTGLGVYGFLRARRMR